MKEIWKDIKGYEGLYQASNLGRIKSISKMVNGSNQFGVKFKYLKKDKILKPVINNHDCTKIIRKLKEEYTNLLLKYFCPILIIIRLLIIKMETNSTIVWKI